VTQGWRPSRTAVHAARTVFLAVALGLCVYAIVVERRGLGDGLRQLNALSVVGALGCVLLALGASMLEWRTVLGDLGSPLPKAPAARIFFLAQLGKYVPGSVWVAVGQMELAKACGVPRQRSAAAYVVVALLTLVSALVVAGVLLPFVAGGGVTEYWWLFLVAPIGLVFLIPPLLNTLLERVLRVTRASSHHMELTFGGVGRAWGWGLLGWFGFGVQIWLLATSLGAPAGQAFAVAVGGFALAWAAGFLAVFAPAGAGAREAALVLTLSPVLSTADAIVVALVSRLLMTVADLGTAAAAVLIGRHSSSRAATGA
jgi:uncharacterized membrane protein YbhN (UPF0104 family)